MDLRLASMDDLSQLKAMYKKIVENMIENNIHIWDEIYPCEFFGDDIENNRLYVLIENNEIVAAFALCHSNMGEDCVQWENKQDKALYMNRLGVNVNYLRKGFGKIVLDFAIGLSREKEAKYLRLFVADTNKPAIDFYVKNGFHKVDGVYDEIVNDDLVLHEFGFEIRL